MQAETVAWVPSGDSGWTFSMTLTARGRSCSARTWTVSRSAATASVRAEPTGVNRVRAADLHRDPQDARGRRPWLTMMCL